MKSRQSIATRRSALCGLVLLLFPLLARADDNQLHAVHPHPEHATEHWRTRPHHLSLVTGTTFDHGEAGETIGIDYEYRVNAFLGLGAVIEQAYGKLDATTALLVADLHLGRGAILQTGPGMERLPETHGDPASGRKNLFVYRFGLLYEFEFDHLTLAPQLHVDVTERSTATVAVVAVGFSF